MKGAPYLPRRPRRSAKRAEARGLALQGPLSADAPARQAAIARRAKQMPSSCRASYLKATRGKASPRVAIKAQCLECVGWQRPEVARCTATACPLWMYRPWRQVDEECGDASAR